MMEAIEIARKLAALNQTKDACRAYTLAVQQETDPAARMEAAAYILQFGGDYRISHTCFRELYNAGYCKEDILALTRAVFYEPNVKLMKTRYERNRKLLAKYPYLFRKDFPDFEDLPILFFPFDDHNGYVPFYRDEQRFGDFVNFGNQVISRNFFRDLDKPVLAADVFSQYEIEYLNDNVRKSEDVGRENHVYLHYSDWGVFCSYLQCLNLRKVLESRKLVFLIGDELGQYPIDFKERFGIDYSQYSVKPIGIREVNRLIWHMQLSTHNGGDFFNEVFDAHPNLIAMPSLMTSNIIDATKKIRTALAKGLDIQNISEGIHWSAHHLRELYRMRDRTDKDIVVALFLGKEEAVCGLDPNSRIAPALFFQPHFENIVYQFRVDGANRTVLECESIEEIRQSPIFRGFKYIKTFTPMRRFTTSHGATVRFMYKSALLADGKAVNGKMIIVSDAVMERVVNRSFMIDPEDRLYKDSVAVRFEDGKLNSKATFSALAAFLDLPYAESMTRCTYAGKDAFTPGNAVGFDPSAIYKTYDKYVNDDERYFIEYFLRDAYEYYGYDFHYYDGAPVDEARCAELINGFTTIDHYIAETWRKILRGTKVSREGERVEEELAHRIQDKLLEDYMQGYKRNRIASAKILLEGLRFVNKNAQTLRMMPKLELNPALLEQPLYH